MRSFHIEATFLLTFCSEHHPTLVYLVPQSCNTKLFFIQNFPINLVSRFKRDLFKKEARFLMITGCSSWLAGLPIDDLFYQLSSEIGKNLKYPHDLTIPLSFLGSQFFAYSAALTNIFHRLFLNTEH